MAQLIEVLTVQCRYRAESIALDTEEHNNVHIMLVPALQQHAAHVDDWYSHLEDSYEQFLEEVRQYNAGSIDDVI